MKVYEVQVPGMAEEVGVQVQENGVAFNLWADGTAGVPEDIRLAAEEHFIPEDCPVIGEDTMSYNPGGPGRTWDDVFKPDINAPQFYADVSDSTTLVVEWNDGWHLCQITKIEGEARGYHHLAGPFASFPNVQDKAVEAFDRIADEQAEAGPGESGEVVHQTFNIGEDDEADKLVMYGIPRHDLNDPAALRRHLLSLYTERERLGTILMRMWPFARRRVDYLRVQRSKLNGDLRYKRLYELDAMIARFDAAQAGARDLGIPEKEAE